MANIDSSIGYSSGTINAYSASPKTDSAIGFATGVINAYSPPAPGYADSLIGYTASSILAPHLPVGIWTSSGLKFVSIKVWDGTNLR